MDTKPLPTFSRLDKVIAITEAVTGVGSTVIIVRGIKTQRWNRLYKTLVVSGACLEGVAFLKGVVKGRRRRSRERRPDASVARSGVSIPTSWTC